MSTYNLLVEHLQEECNRAGMEFDQDDAEFVLDTIISFCSRNRMEVAGAGVRRVFPRI